MNKFWSGKSVLITGGTGSLGKKLTSHILTHFPEVRRVIIYSRDEQKQFVMDQEYPHSKYPQIRFFIGDVCLQGIELCEPCKTLGNRLQTASMSPAASALAIASLT